MVDINSWSDLIKAVSSIGNLRTACRGQSKVFTRGVESRIDRCLRESDEKKGLRRERALIQRFREHASIHLSPVEQQYLQTPWLQLVVMQHYGAPTRLLDWSKSPFVAAYFACEDLGDDDGVVYVFGRKKLERHIEDEYRPVLGDIALGQHKSDNDFSTVEWDNAVYNKEFLKRSDYKRFVATYYVRKGHFPRLIAQQGLFTFASRPYIDHWLTIENTVGPKRCWKWIIHKEAKKEILTNLYSAGINAATLFPGLEGVGRSMVEFAKSWVPPEDELE